MKPLQLRLIFSCVLLFTTVVFQFTGCSGDKEPDGPHITSISPESGAAGTAVIINGVGLSAAGQTPVVKFNGVTAKNGLFPSDARIDVTAPAFGKTGPITVTLGDLVITGPTFTYAEPEPAETYYIKYKANDDWFMFEAGQPGYPSCGHCGCGSLPPLADENASVAICHGDDYVTAEMIEAYAGQTFGFGSDLPEGSFSFDINGDTYYTDAAEQNSSSKITVTSVESDGSYIGVPAYKVKGTFSCKVAKSSGGSPITITEGEFVLRYSPWY